MRRLATPRICGASGSSVTFCKCPRLRLWHIASFLEAFSDTLVKILRRWCPPYHSTVVPFSTHVKGAVLSVTLWVTIAMRVMDPSYKNIRTSMNKQRIWRTKIIITIFRF